MFLSLALPMLSGRGRQGPETRGGGGRGWSSPGARERGGEKKDFKVVQSGNKGAKVRELPKKTQEPGL